MSRYRFGQEKAQALRRALCPPHRAEDLYDRPSLTDGRPRVSCYRCYHDLALGTVAELRADPLRLALVLEAAG